MLLRDNFFVDVPKVLVIDPTFVAGNQVALACQAAGILQSYTTSFVYNPTSPLSRLHQILPGTLRHRAARILKRRYLPELDHSYVRSVVWPEMVGRAILALPRAIRPSETRIFRISDRLFERLCYPKLPPEATLVYAVEGIALEIFKRAGRVGAVRVLQGSIHSRYAASVLETEYGRLGLPYSRDTEGITRLEREYLEADHIIVQSKFAASTFAKSGITESKMVAIPLGVDLSTFSPAREERRLTSTDPIRLLYAGRLSVRKGVARLIDAIAGLPDARIELTLIGIMDRDFEPVWQRIRHSMGSRLRWVPGISRNELPDHYRRAHLFVLPSLIDSFGAAALEAMASGTAVLVTDACGVPIRAGVDGMVIPAGNTRALAEAISSLVSDPERLVHYGTNGRERASQFPWSRFQQKALEFIYSAIDARETIGNRPP